MKHIATILATAYDLKFSKQRMKEVYERLKHKKAWIRSKYPWGSYNYYVVRRVFWSCKILDLKKVQDEIGILTKGDLLSKDNPEDRKIVQQAIKWLHERDRQKPFERVIDENIDFLNLCIHKTRAFLARSTEFHRKHPETKFWFYVEFDQNFDDSSNVAEDIGKPYLKPPYLPIVN